MNLNTYEDYEELGHYFALDRRTHRTKQALRKPAVQRPRQAPPREIAEQMDGDDCSEDLEDFHDVI